MRSRRVMPRGWTVLLCAYLLGWVPIRFANELLSVLPSIGRRGRAALAETFVHGASAALCAAAGWMLLVRNPDALRLSLAAVVLSSLVNVQSAFWTVLPSQLAPGDRLPLALSSAAHALFWALLIGYYARRLERPPM